MQTLTLALKELASWLLWTDLSVDKQIECNKNLPGWRDSE